MGRMSQLRANESECWPAFLILRDGGEVSFHDMSPTLAEGLRLTVGSSSANFLFTAFNRNFSFALEIRLLYLAASTLLLCRGNDMRNHIESPVQRPPGPGFPGRTRDLRPGFATVPMD